MPERAHVTSVEALESFRSNLIVYLSKARPALEEVSADVQRMRGWLEGEQRTYWESEVRRRSQAWQEARQTLFSAKLSGLREASAAEQMTVQRTKRALDEAERLYRAGTRDAAALRNALQGIIAQAPAARIDYIAVVDDETLAPVQTLTKPALVALAVYIGTTRLIDNTVLQA